MKLVIDHLTRYGYDEEVKFSTQYLRLTPRSTGRQTIPEFLPPRWPEWHFSIS